MHMTDLLRRLPAFYEYFTVVLFQGKGEVMTYWLVDADETKKRRISEHEKNLKCHNAKIGSQFSVSRLRQNSPSSLRHRLLARGGRVTPGSFDGSMENSPTILKRSFIRRKKVGEQSGLSNSMTCLASEQMHLLTPEETPLKHSSLVVDMPNGDVKRDSTCV